MELLLLLGHLVMQTSMETSLQEVYLMTKLTLDGRFFVWKMGYDMETSSIETLPKDEVKEVNTSVLGKEMTPSRESFIS